MKPSSRGIDYTKEKANLPYGFAAPEPKIIRAVQCFLEGTANANQQRTVAGYILYTLCGITTEPFIPEHDALTRYMQGRQSVGMMLMKVAAMKPEQNEEKDG